MSSVTRSLPYAGVRWLGRIMALFVAGIVASRLEAQGLPSFTPINPMATARSGVYFEPYRNPVPNRWVIGFGLEYASTIEYNDRLDAEYILDSELLRLDLSARRDLGPKSFVLMDVNARGAYDGFLDGFLDWYHHLLGITLRERERRPRNEFLYHIVSKELPAIEQQAGDFFLGDVRIGGGWRYSRSLQGVVALTLPTTTGPSGYGRRTVSASVLHTFRAPLSRRFVYEGSVGVGYTPTHGRLAPFQRQLFAEVSSGVRSRLWGQQAVYANLLYHSPYYHGTGFAALDRYDLALDFGWLIASCTGPEWRFGLTEDPKPKGPGIDLMVRLGVALRTGTAPCAGVKNPWRQDPGR